MGKNSFLNLQKCKSLGENRKFNTLLPTMVLLLAWVIMSTAVVANAVEYDASEVDKPPKLVRQTPVQYPPKAKRNKVEGRVVLRCLITTDGNADKIEVVESDPEGVFDENAMRSLKYWKFRPGVLKGEMVNTWVKIPMNFKP